MAQTRREFIETSGKGLIGIVLALSGGAALSSCSRLFDNLGTCGNWDIRIEYNQDNEKFPDIILRVCFDNEKDKKFILLTDHAYATLSSNITIRGCTAEISHNPEKGRYEHVYTEKELEYLHVYNGAVDIVDNAVDAKQRGDGFMHLYRGAKEREEAARVIDSLFYSLDPANFKPETKQQLERIRENKKS